MFTHNEYKEILKEQEKQVNLSYQDKLNIIEQQAIITEDMDMLQQINSKRFSINEDYSEPMKIAATQSMKTVKDAYNKTKDAITDNPGAAAGIQTAGTIGILGLTKLISSLRKKRQEKIQKNQSTKEIDQKLRSAINKKKKMQSGK